MSHTAANTTESTPPQPRVGLLHLYADLTKLRLSLLVVVTAGVGAIMASGDDIQWLRILWMVLGTLMCAAAANAINQVIEVRRDALMTRTSDRPLPSGRMSAVHGWTIAIVLGYGGVAVLATLVNFYSAGLALLTLLLYVLAYTPMKPLSTLNTLIGAVVGAIPPLVGWVAIRGTIDSGGLVLAAILFLWQLPHFLTLAWMYREEYETAGFRMLPSVAGGERILGEATLISAMLLIPLGLLMTSMHLTGLVYSVGSVLIGVWFAWKCLVFYRTRTSVTARRAFLASLVYLPAVLLVMALDRQPVPMSQPIVLTPAPMEAP